MLSEWLDTHAAPGERSVRHGQMMLSHNNEDLSAGSSRIRARRARIFDMRSSQYRGFVKTKITEIGQRIPVMVHYRFGS